MGLRTHIARARPVASARSAAAVLFAPVVRRQVARAPHRRRLEWVRWLVPGSHGQRPNEIVALAELVARRDPVAVCEIGTLMGGTSLFLTGLAPTIRTFVGIDVELHNHRLIASLAPPWVAVHHIEGSSIDPNVQRRIAEILDGVSLDLLFIDGDHSYEGVRDDFRNYRGLVAPGGLIAFHDIVDDRGGRFWSGGVPALWQQVRPHFPYWEFIQNPEQESFGIGVIEHEPTVQVEL